MSMCISMSPNRCPSRVQAVAELKICSVSCRWHDDLLRSSCKLWRTLEVVGSKLQIQFALDLINSP